MPIISLPGKRPPDLGVADGVLRACPKSPNCVCSDDPRSSHGIDDFVIRGDPAAVWRAVVEAASMLPGADVIDAEDDYIHVECTSKLLGFVDDLELHLRSGDGRIAVRSASRLGYSDMGVNRKRVEALRAALRAGGAIA